MIMRWVSSVVGYLLLVDCYLDVFNGDRKSEVLEK